MGRVLVHTAVIVTAFISTSPALATTCADLFRMVESPMLQLDPLSAAWKNLMVRLARQPVSNTNYLHNQSYGLRKIFDPWFRGTNPETDFAVILSQQHSALVLGPPGLNRAYRPKSSKWQGYVHLKVEPAGRYRQEIEELGHEVRQMYFREEVFEDYDLPPSIFEKIETRAKGNSWKQQIDGIPERAWPENDAPYRMSETESGESVPNHELPFRMMHSLPRAEHVPIYVKRAGEIMNEIRSQQALSLPNLSTLLGKYFHVLINAHPFYYGNNSLFLAQINYVLLERGFSGIPHGGLDYLALITSTNEFVPHFVNEIQKANRRR